MPYGLQVFDASGGVTVDITDRLTRFHSDYTATIIGGGSSDIAVTGISTDGTWAVTCSQIYFGYEIHPGFVRVFNHYTGLLSGYLQVFRI